MYQNKRLDQMDGLLLENNEIKKNYCYDNNQGTKLEKGIWGILIGICITCELAKTSNTLLTGLRITSVTG